jgi:hypothetical protein
MRTLVYKSTYASTAQQTCLTLTVQEASQATIRVYDVPGSGSTVGTIKTFYNFDDGTSIEDTSDSVTVSSLKTIAFGYKTGSITIKYTPGNSAGTVRVEATTAK